MRVVYQHNDVSIKASSLVKDTNCEWVSEEGGIRVRVTDRSRSPSDIGEWYGSLNGATQV